MERTCIATVDATRARLFIHERTATPDGVHDQLSESVDLVNPVRHQAPHDVFADSGTRGGMVAGRGFGLDDHRAAHLAEMDKAFARDVLAEIDRLVKAKAIRRLVLCAEPHMLGLLREHGSTIRHGGLIVDEIRRDLAQLSAPELRSQLASYGVLPPIARAS